MQTSTRPEAPGSLGRVRQRLYGLVFLCVLGSLVALSVAAYNKTFTHVVPVSLETGRIGNQLNEMSDVKLRGMRVGEVREVSSNGRHATIEMALDPSQAPLVPANVEARILPKTLFGEKYVELVVPSQASTQAIAAGDVIRRDRSETAIELERVLDDVLPVLRTVKPAQLNATLYALSHALEGRGERIGENLERVNTYLTQLNPHMETLQADVTGLADFAETYAAATPDLMRVLRNTAATSRTVVAKQDALAATLAGTTGMAGTADQVLTENESNLIRLADVSRPVLDLLATYSPEYPCLLQGLAEYDKPLSEAFGGGYQGLHITLEVVDERGPFRPGIDDPAYGAGSGPDCHGLPDPPQPQPGAEIEDGAANDGGSGLPLLGRATPQAFGATPSTGPAGTGAERDFVAPLIASQSRTTPEEVPDLTALMFAPMARGTAVSIQ
jgi:phospholipid/cholesterol/gamma-HCH transport system substrate-binding protein